MKFYYLSDLHLDSWINSSYNIDMLIFDLINNINTTDSCLIIAGDISHSYTLTVSFLSKISNYFESIFYVFGNHDYWLLNLDDVKKFKKSDVKIKNILNKIKNIDNIFFLDGDTIIDYKGINIYGNNMWYDINNVYFYLWLQYMNDSKYIVTLDTPKLEYYNGKMYMYRFNVKQKFKECINKLNKIYDVLKYKNINIDITVTHFPPFKVEEINELDHFFYFDGEKYIQNFNTKYWIFGHVHLNDYENIINNKIFLCNCLGYKNELNKNIKNVLKFIEI